MKATIDITEGLSTEEFGELTDAAREERRSLADLLLEGARTAIRVRREKRALVSYPPGDTPPAAAAHAA